MKVFAPPELHCDLISYHLVSMLHLVGLILRVDPVEHSLLAFFYHALCLALLLRHLLLQLLLLLVDCDLNFALCRVFIEA